MIKIVEKRDCCGCTACMSVCPAGCISMKADEEGFLYPEVDTGSCIGCGLCEKVCPVLNAGGPRKPLLSLAFRTEDAGLLERSASGGAFPEIARRILEKGGVVFGSRFDDRHQAVHDFAENAAGLSRFTGSKYLQSRMEDNYRKVRSFLLEGRHVMFTGTPCQVAGLNAFLRKPYDRLLTVDLICHGVPSPAVWGKYLQEEILSAGSRNGMENVQVEEVRFRDKEFSGWKGYDFTIFFSGSGVHGGRRMLRFSEKGKEENLFIRGFLSDLYSRPSCYRCPARCFRSGSDITIGDFWGIERFSTLFDDNRGASAVLANTPKGVDMLSSIEAVKVQMEYADVLGGNRCLEYSVSLPPERDMFFKDLSDANVHERIRECLRIKGNRKS